MLLAQAGESAEIVWLLLRTRANGETGVLTLKGTSSRCREAPGQTGQPAGIGGSPVDDKGKEFVLTSHASANP